jgi:glucose-6-phosphate dehydrogenase assembly protein OpcA
MSAATTWVAPRLEVSSKRVELDRVEDELRFLWHDSNACPEGVIRACRSNLIVFTGSTQEARRARGDVAAIARAHPGRVIQIEYDPDRLTLEIEASVSVQCSRDRDGKRVCSEQVTLQASRGSVRRLPSTVRDLLVGDLPTTLWWAAAEAPNLSSTGFQELSGMAEHVIMDSDESDDARESLRTLAAWMADERAGFTLSDLAWKRLQSWREIISQTLNPMLSPGALRFLRSVSLESGLRGLAESWLLTAWLARSLAWQFEGSTGETGWSFRSPEGPVQVARRTSLDLEGGVKRISLAWKGPQGSTIAGFGVTGSGCLSGTLDDTAGPGRTLFVPAQSRAALVSKLLSERRWDASYLGALSMVRRMAGAGRQP